MKPRLQRSLALSSVLGLLLGAGVTSDAAADEENAWERTIIVPAGAPTLSGLSGRSGRLTLANVPQGAFLYSISSWERADSPCKSRATYWYEHAVSPRNPVRAAEFPRYDANNCTPNPGSERGTFIYGGGQRQLDGSTRGVAGVQVCMNKQRTRVKGIKLLGARISPDGTVTHSSAYDHAFERPNCKTPWEPVKRCPGDSVATGVHLHHFGASLSGIELMCQQVEVRTLADPR